VSIVKFVSRLIHHDAVPRLGLFLTLSSVARKFFALYSYELCGPEFMNQIWFVLLIEAYLIFYFLMRCRNKQVGIGGANVYPESSNRWKSFMDLMMMVALLGLNIMWGIFMPSTCP
jgi:hypothetical protein